jgi:hypothetical protein
MGVLADEAALADALARQSERLPLASICYVLGYAGERELSEALVLATGHAVIVLDECVIDTTLVDGVAPDLLRRMQMLPVYADAGTIYVAASRPDEVAGHAQALFARRGWAVTLCGALSVTVARTLRGVLAARARDELRWIGPEAATDARARHPRLAMISPDDTLDDARLGERAAQAVIEDVTKEIAVDHLFPDTPEGEPSRDTSMPPRPPTVAGDTPWTLTGAGSSPGRDLDPDAEAPEDDVGALASALERGPVLDASGPPRLLIVDDDFATRHLLVKEI